MNHNSSTSTEQLYDTLTPDLKQWVREASRTLNIPEQQIISSSCLDYGSVEGGRQVYMDMLQMEEEREKDLMRRGLLPPGEPIKLGAKPSAQEKVIITPINDNIAIRIWGDNLASLHLFSFDLVNKARKYIRPPPGVKIYTVGGLLPVSEVHSIEKSVDMSDTNGSLRNSVDKSIPADPDWETYLIPEGTKLRITVPNCPDVFLNIPSRQPEGRVLQIQPYW